MTRPQTKTQNQVAHGWKRIETGDDHDWDWEDDDDHDCPCGCQFQNANRCPYALRCTKCGKRYYAIEGHTCEVQS